MLDLDLEVGVLLLQVGRPQHNLVLLQPSGLPRPEPGFSDEKEGVSNVTSAFNKTLAFL